MYLQPQIDFDRISEAIEFIKNNFKSQPSLDEIANHVNMSPSHFQKMFTHWSGISPKKMLQYVTVNYAKSILQTEKATLFNTTFDSGLSSTSRLHDLFVTIEAMTPAEFKNGGASLTISYSFADTNFGKIIIASTYIGICHIAFYEDENVALKNFKLIFTNAQFLKESKPTHQDITLFFNNDFTPTKKIKLHLRGTNFQLKVWQALLTIPSGKLSTYGQLASTIQSPKAARAVGTAIGSNPVAFLIPCHRVIQATGIFGGYMWGPKRKTAIIGWEAAQKNLK